MEKQKIFRNRAASSKLRKTAPIDHAANIKIVKTIFTVFGEHSGSLIFHLDADMRIKNLNMAALKYFHLKKNKVLGKNIGLLKGCDKFLEGLHRTKKAHSKLATKLLIQNPEQVPGKQNVEWFFWNLTKIYQVPGYLIIGNVQLDSYIKMLNLRIDGYLKEITSCMPGNFYWKDREGRYLGCNKGLWKTLDLEEKDIIGKTDYDLWPEQAEELRKNDNTVMATNEPIYLEETVQIKNREPMFFAVIKAPLKDANGSVIGIIGNSLDITYRKKAENIMLEYELQKITLDEHEKFRRIVDQVAHDIRSPLSSLSMIIKSCQYIPESERIALREAAIGIEDIANNLLDKYRNKIEAEENKKIKQPLIVSLFLMQILTGKKYQYNNLPIKFSCEFNKRANFSFINASASDFKRMFSNIINNAVESYEGKEGTVHVELDVSNDIVNIVIKDHGKGMSQETINKIMQNVAVTNDKEEGHGIGYSQVQEVLKNNNGKLEVNSKVGKGTKITLSFPKIDVPKWMAEQIELNNGDVVIILDDDNSVHSAWKTRFKGYMNDIQLKHFKSGDEVINFINSVPNQDKVFLLADFELLKQDLNGLQVIERSKAKRSILVTSHYANPKVLELVKQTNTKILPKQLASDIPILTSKRRENQAIKVELVVIDDNPMFTDAIAILLETALKVKVDKYYNPKVFLANLAQYSIDTKICMDNNLNSKLTGLELAEQLHKLGYTKLYLLSGKDFDSDQIPGYLKLIMKGVDSEEIINALK